jgi:hypothetical protein
VIASYVIASSNARSDVASAITNDPPNSESSEPSQHSSATPTKASRNQVILKKKDKYL